MAVRPPICGTRQTPSTTRLAGLLQEIGQSLLSNSRLDFEAKSLGSDRPLLPAEVPPKWQDDIDAIVNKWADDIFRKVN